MPLCSFALQIAPVANTGSAAATAAAAADTHMTIEIKEPRVVESHPIEHNLEAKSSTDSASTSNPDGLASTAAVSNPAAAGSPETLPLLQLVSVGDSPTESMLLPVFNVTNDVNTDSQPAGSAAAVAVGDSAASSSGSRKLQQSGATAVQDALVVYTKLAADAVGGVDALLSLVQQNFARTNLAYTDSKVPIQLSMLAFRQVSWRGPAVAHVPCNEG
jgi:hypothetical protein